MLKVPVIVDTLSFRLRETTLEKTLDFLGLGYGDVPWDSRGGFNVNYRSSLYCEGIRIGFDSVSDWDTYVHMSGRGCRYFEDVMSRSNCFNWFSVLNHLCECVRAGTAAITRIDLACDVYTDVLRLDRIERYIIQHKYITRCSDRSIRLVKFGEECLYVGSTQSLTLLRIYNKKLERGYSPEDSEIDFWYRAELQFRDSHAEQVVLELGDRHQIGSVFCGHLRYHFNFLKDVNKRDGTQSRIPLAAWWRDFLNDEEPIDWIPAPGSEYNLSRLERYALKGCGSTIKTLIRSKGWNAKRLYEFYNSDTISLRVDQQSLIDQEQDRLSLLMSEHTKKYKVSLLDKVV